jgi:SAM-dependent methyltransferase
LADSGALRGRVLDVGCGTGENTLMAATASLDATGIDLAADALAASPMDGAWTPSRPPALPPPCTPTASPPGWPPAQGSKKES